MSDEYGVDADMFHGNMKHSKKLHESALFAIKDLQSLNLRILHEEPDFEDEGACGEEAEIIESGTYAELLTNMLSRMPHLQRLGSFIWAGPNKVIRSRTYQIFAYSCPAIKFGRVCQYYCWRGCQAPSTMSCRF